MKIETPPNFDFIVFMALKSKVYYQKLAHVDNTEEKMIFKHKGIGAVKDLSAELFDEILQKGKIKETSKEKQFHTKLLRIFCANVDKQFSNSFDAKMYYFNTYFALPYGHPDVKLFKDTT